MASLVVLIRVLHVIPGIAPRYGGPSMAIGSMCAALNRLPETVVEIATTDADGAGGRIDETCLPSGAKTHLFRRSWSERWKFSIGLGHWLRRHVPEYDLVHIHSLWSYSSFAAGRAARRFKTPYILRPAGMLSAYTLGRRAWSKKLSWRLFERRLVKNAAAFHATSADEAKEFAVVRPGASVFVIPHGVDSAAWEIPPNPEQLRQRCGLVDNKVPILLFLSRLHPKKGITDILLPAFAQLKRPAILAIVGGPDPHAIGYEAVIRQTIDQLGLNGRVFMLGAVSGNARWQMFDGAAAFVLPSHSENFGIVVAEAMARRCPAIVTEQVQASEHVVAAGAGRVTPLDPAAIAVAIEELLADPKMSSDLGRRGQEYAREQLGWEKAATSIREMYIQCLNMSPTRTAAC